MVSVLSQVFGKSIRRLIMSSFVIVLMVPLGFAVYSLYQNTWSQAQNRMLEKHHLIATTLIEPFELFITSREESLKALGKKIQGNNASIFDKKSLIDTENLLNRNKLLLENYSNTFGDIVAVSYQASNGINALSTNGIDSKNTKIPNYSEIKLNRIKKSGSNLYISPVFQSTFSSKPVVLLRQSVTDRNNAKVGSIFVELSLKYIESMCSKINFGVKGHCAVVDQLGHVLAHPNKSWAQAIRDISKISVVQKMMRGESGVTEFYSPFLKADMVAGYSHSPLLGWGIMIPQPKKELSDPLYQIKRHTIMWILAGILIALTIAYFLARKITSPIKNLMDRTKELDDGHDYIGLGAAPKNSPIEIEQLWNSFAKLLTGLQISNKEVKRLNVSLNRDIEKATQELRLMNDNLKEISVKDDLTEIPNRRYFNRRLEKVIFGKKRNSIGIMLIDIDNFKTINDTYGHEAGDVALQHVSRFFTDSLRKKDVVARYGGDEFAVYMKNLDDETFYRTAEKLRKLFSKTPMVYNNNIINLTVSIGLYNYDHNDDYAPKTLKEILSLADKALYESKYNGRNRVSLYQETGDIFMNKNELLLT